MKRILSRAPAVSKAQPVSKAPTKTTAGGGVFPPCIRRFDRNQRADGRLRLAEIAWRARSRRGGRFAAGEQNRPDRLAVLLGKALTDLSLRGRAYEG